MKIEHPSVEVMEYSSKQDKDIVFLSEVTFYNRIKDSNVKMNKW